MKTSRGILYFPGLSGTKPNGFDTRVLKSFDGSMQIEFADMDWRANEPFDNLLGRMIDRANKLLKTTAQLALVGASAGGSLAINVFGNLDSENTRAVSLSGRMRAGELTAWDLRTLERSTHLGTDRASQLCYDSINYCENMTLPILTDEEKTRITTTKPAVDFVVPRSTMDIEGVEPITNRAVGHKLGIYYGLQQLPAILEA